MTRSCPHQSISTKPTDISLLLHWLKRNPWSFNMTSRKYCRTMTTKCSSIWPGLCAINQAKKKTMSITPHLNLRIGQWQAPMFPRNKIRIWSLKTNRQARVQSLRAPNQSRKKRKFNCLSDALEGAVLMPSFMRRNTARLSKRLRRWWRKEMKRSVGPTIWLNLTKNCRVGTICWRCTWLNKSPLFNNTKMRMSSC